MRYARMGDSGLLVSRLSLGTMTFSAGSHHLPGVAGVDEAGAARMVARAIERGVNFFDSADGYSKGESEQLLGRALRGRRDDAVVCTKFGVRRGEAITRAGLSRRHAMASIDASLERLGMDHVDIFMCHRSDPGTPIEETLIALDEIVKAGKARYVGFSNWPAWLAATALQFQKDNGLAPFVAGQIYYSLASRDAELDLIPMMAHHGVGMMVWSPLAFGFLSGKYTRENIGDDTLGRLANLDGLPTDKERGFRTLDALREIAAGKGCSVPQAALAWLLHKPGTTNIILGANRLEQLDDNLGAADVALTAEEIARLDECCGVANLYPHWFEAAGGDRQLATVEKV